MPADDWASFFAAFATDLAADRDLDRSSRVIVEHVPIVVPDAGHVALTLRRRRGFTTLDWTTDLAHEGDELQRQLRQGPVFDAAHDGDHVRSGDLRRENRWRQWSAAMAERGAGSMLSVRLSTHGEPFGAITVYSASLGRFDDPQELDRVKLLAAHAAHALEANRTVTGLRTAMQSRHTIGVAQGILMRAYGLDIDGSFALLTRYSSEMNVKLRTLAEYVVQHGDLPGSEDRAVLDVLEDA